MAANYWESRWAQCIASKQRLLETQMDDRARGLTEDQLQQIKVHFIASISEFVKQYKLTYKVELRQRIAATASVYFRRFYLKACFCHIDPRLVFVGCIYLASKVEESGLPAKHLVTFAKKCRPGWNYEMKHILDIEMVIMENLNFNLVVFSPYRSLVMFLRDSSAGNAVGLRAWTILNDSYRTDVSLMYAPHMVALACLQLAVVLVTQGPDAGAAASGAGGSEAGAAAAPGRSAAPEPARSAALQERLSDWMAGLAVDLDKVYDIVVEITAMYDRYLTPISADECGRLLDVVQGAQGSAPAPVTTAVANRTMGYSYK